MFMLKGIDSSRCTIIVCHCNTTVPALTVSSIPPCVQPTIFRNRTAMKHSASHLLNTDTCKSSHYQRFGTSSSTFVPKLPERALAER
mmetsp:Transcript_6448/g.10571  ORF Transcript_6448/g.10571 Transcript_6448/m.10571 type:complete len:87 (-) Transcript_6448:36-296(-)